MKRSSSVLKTGFLLGIVQMHVLKIFKNALIIVIEELTGQFNSLEIFQKMLFHSMVEVVVRVANQTDQHSCTRRQFGIDDFLN